MSNESTWAPVMERMKRRLQAGGKVIALGAFMSAKKEALPILAELQLTPAAVDDSEVVRKGLTEKALAFCTKDRCGSPIRAGLAKKFITALLNEVPLEPVTDEEVAKGVALGTLAHEEKVAAKRAARQAGEQRSAAGSAGGGGSTPGPEEDEGEEVEDESDDSSAEADDAGADEDAADTVDDEDEDEKTPVPTPPSHSAANRAPSRRAPRVSAGRHHNPNEDEMSNRDRDEMDENDDQYEGQHDDEGQEEQDDPPPSKRSRAARQQQPQVILVPQQAAPRQKAARAAAPVKNRFMPRNNDRVSIWKRIAGGKRSFIGDYTAEEIGPGISLPQFIKEYIDEENREPTGRTTYEVIPIDQNGNEIGRAMTHIIDSAPQDMNPNDPVSQARSVLDLVADMRQGEDEKNSRNGEMLAEAKKKAIAGGDMNGLMMFLLMERMTDRPRSGMDEATLVAKVLDRLQPQAPPMPMMMPPQLPPVAPPAPAPLAGAMEQLVQASIASMLKPEAPPPSPMQQLKDMMELQALMAKMSGGGTDMAGLIKLLLEKQAVPAKPAEVAGVDNMMLTFEKLTTMVKALAPQINQGGWAGPLQGILSQPDVQKALGSIIGGVTGQPGQVPTAPPAPGQQVVNGAAAPAQVAAGTPQQPTPTPQMRDAANAFRIAQTKEVRVERLMQLVQVMYMSGYQPIIDPVLIAAREGNLEQAQRFLATLISDINPAAVSLDLINATLRVSAAMAGEEGKKMLVALDASDKAASGGGAQPAPASTQNIETPNSTAKVVPIAAAPAHAHHEAYMAQVAEIEKRKKEEATKGPATQPSVPAAANPHAPEVEVREKKVVAPPPPETVEAPPAAPPAAPEPMNSAVNVPPTSPQPAQPTAPAEVVQFTKPAEQAQPTAT